MVSKFINEKGTSIAYLANRTGINPEIILRILEDYEPEGEIQMVLVKLYCETKWN